MLRRNTLESLSGTIFVLVVRIASVAEVTANLLDASRVPSRIRVLAIFVGDVGDFTIEHRELEGYKLTDGRELPKT